MPRRSMIPDLRRLPAALPRRPSWSRRIPAGTIVFLVSIGVWVVAALTLTSGAASMLPFEVHLESNLSADYGPDPIGARFHELRLSIVEEVLSGPPGQEGEAQKQAAVEQMLSKPVPTATPDKPREELKQIATESSNAEPGGTPTSQLTEESMAAVEPTSTPVPGQKGSRGATPDCSMITISDTRVKGQDQVRAQVHNGNALDAYLVHTVLEWPDVPPPAFVDWFRFGGKYFTSDDSSSPTVASGSSVRLRHGKSQDWKADFDNFPEEGIYGAFFVSLTFEYPGWGTCELMGSAFKDFPPTEAPSPGPSETASPAPPTATSSPEPPVSPAPSDTPESTATVGATPSATVLMDTPTPAPTDPSPTPAN